MSTRATASLLAVSTAAALILIGWTAHADEFERSRAQIRYVMEFHHIPSVTVAVAQKGKIVWEESFGWADVAKREPATPHTPYAIASTTKPMTATAIMILAQRGAIDLDKPIDDYLGAQKLTAHVGSAKDATIRRIASHTAGLPLHARFFYADESASAPNMDETIRRYGSLVTAPGEAFVYSNLDYALLEHAIELVSGKSYAAFLHDEIFAPLGLVTGEVNPRPEAGRPVATRYWVDGSELPFYDFDQLGAGGVTISAHDLLRFGMFHLYGHLDGEKKAVLPRSALASMRDPVLLNDGSPAGYGFDAKTSLLLLDDLLGSIDAPDATRHGGKLQLSLKLRDANTLNGSLASNALERLPDRMGDAVSYWVELHKKKQNP